MHSVSPRCRAMGDTSGEILIRNIFLLKVLRYDIGPRLGPKIKFQPVPI